MLKERVYIIVRYLLIALIVTLVIGFGYTAVQQNYRLTANDPQIQLAEDSADILASGQNPADMVPGEANTDMAKSLAPFIIVYDDSGKVVASSVKLDGQTPSLPGGVLDYAKNHTQNTFTWQPKSGVRIAAVAVHY